jgi:hypothetical protein
MAREDVERLVGRAVLDPEFREKFFADPEGAIREAGLELSEEELDRVKQVDREKAKVAVEEMAALTGQPWGGSSAAGSSHRAPDLLAGRSEGEALGSLPVWAGLDPASLAMPGGPVMHFWLGGEWKKPRADRRAKC